MEIQEKDLKINDVVLSAKNSRIYAICILGFTEKYIKCSRQKVDNIYTLEADRSKHNDVFYTRRYEDDWKPRNFYLINREENGY